METKIKRYRFENFNVFTVEERYTFISLNINSKDFAKSFFDYFFSEKNLFAYCKNEKEIIFSPNKKNFVILYRLLKRFIDEEIYLKLDTNDLPTEDVKILEEEYNIDSSLEEINLINIRLDKLGKIGEYVFSVILNNFFMFDCVLPKLMLTTNPNMSIYGIDCIYYSNKNNLLLFGESKVSKSLENGISLINTSLKNYESMIKNEYDLILTNELLNKISNLPDEFRKISECSISFEDFIKAAKIKTIGIPIFIAHGGDFDYNEILPKLKQIKKNKVFGINTIYYIFSLPIINKNAFMEELTQFIKDKCEKYGN